MTRHRIGRYLRALLTGEGRLFALRHTRLYFMQRYKDFNVSLHGEQFRGIDSASFIFMYEEIFNKQQYDFVPEVAQPRIIDGGANIGLSILYFKSRFPESSILAFEPDPSVFDVLRRNVEVQSLSGIELHNKALGAERGFASFSSTGSDSGRVTSGVGGCNIRVEVDTLKDYLNQPVDLLKLDIEGGEYDVISSSEKQLSNVKRIFVEYHSFAGETQKLGELLTILGNSGFRYYLETAGFTNRTPFLENRTVAGMDCQINIFATRV